MQKDKKKMYYYRMLEADVERARNDRNSLVRTGYSPLFVDTEVFFLGIESFKKKYGNKIKKGE